MRRLLPLALLVLAAPAFDQIPAPERWFPLGQGDEWVYRTWESGRGGGSQPPYSFVGFHSHRVTGDTVLTGVPYALVESEKYDSTGVLRWRRPLAIRLHESGGHHLIVVFDLTNQSWSRVYPFTCSGTPLPDRPDTTATVTIGGLEYALPVADTTKSCGGGPIYIYDSGVFALDVGLLSGYGLYNDAGSGGGHYRNEAVLVYARVGGVTYGTVNPVASEPAPAPASSFAVAVYPSPTRGVATLRLALPSAGAARVEAFSVLGRRVYGADLGARPAGRSEVALDASWWAPGVYVVRVTTADGAVASTSLVRSR